MIYKLFKNLKQEFKILQVLPQKKTARCPLSIIVEVDHDKKLVVIAKTDIQKFYLKRSIEKQKEFYNDFSPYFKFNFPDKYGEIDTFSYAIYPYIENLQWVTDDRPIEIIKEVYSKYSKTYKMTQELLEKIEGDFLSSWPSKFHKKIKTSQLYKEYFKKISQENEVQICKEHCDYTVNNILTDGKDMYLMDFEFSKSFQIIGHDEHDYKRTQALEYLQKKNYSKLKECLMDDINDSLDKRTFFKFQSLKILKTACSKCFGGG